MDYRKHPKADFKDIDSLDRDEAAKEAQALREGIEYHDHLYYVKNRPEISDALYDKLFFRLQELEKAFPDLRRSTSPTMRVGAEPVDELKKVQHAAPMLSLNAVLEDKDVRDYISFVERETDQKNVTYVVEPKFDGLSVEVVYRDGRFEGGATRGNGQEGEDITENLKTVRSIPMGLRNQKNLPSFLAARGEVFMPKSGFQKLNKKRVEQGDTPFANPRNAAAGTMRQLDPKNVADKPLDIFFYDILKIDNGDCNTHWQAMKCFEYWGLKTDPHKGRCHSLKEIKKFHEKLAVDREDMPYEIDGIVIKLNDYALRESLGVRYRSPRWALAWKFAPKKEVTTLEDITVSVGRTGILTPVALLQPVDVGGVTVSRATLHNESELKKKDVRPGDRVRVARAGDVIPEVIERIKISGRKRGKPFNMPDRCPACGAKVVRDGAYILCPANLTCPPQQVGRVFHYGSRDALDIRGLGEKTAQDLVKKGLVHNIADLYDLSQEDLLTLEGFADKSAGQLYQAIQDSKSPSLDGFIYALGIRHVGQRAARILAQAFGTLAALGRADRSRLEKIPEIGPEIARSVHHFFRQEENQKVLKRLLDAGVRPKAYSTDDQRRPLEGQTFVFTGELSTYTRDEAEEAVERLGGRATSSVSGVTDYLVVGENPGSKLEDAKAHGTKIIDKNEFEKLLKV